MKDATQQWLNFAEIDLRTCEKLLGDDLLTSVVAFHSQQVVEKCFKAIIEEQGLQLARIHTLARLFGLIQNSIPFTVDTILLQKMDTVYTTSRYPGDFGLLPEGKPTKELAFQLYEFAKYIYKHTNEMIA
jgi:HEPN domain-containing protein